MPKRELWTRDQQLVVFRHYCRVPFGQLDAKNLKLVSSVSSSDGLPEQSPKKQSISRAWIQRIAPEV